MSSGVSVLKVDLDDSKEGNAGKEVFHEGLDPVEATEEQMRFLTKLHSSNGSKAVVFAFLKD